MIPVRIALELRLYLFKKNFYLCTFSNIRTRRSIDNYIGSQNYINGIGVHVAVPNTISLVEPTDANYTAVSPIESFWVRNREIRVYLCTRHVYRYQRTAGINETNVRTLCEKIM